MPPLTELLLRGAASLGRYGSPTTFAQIVALLTVPSVLLKRQGRPRAAMSWLLVLFAVPTFGVVLWWAFGRTSLDRKRRQRARMSRAFVERYGPAHTELGTPFDGLLPPLAVGDSIFTSKGNQVELLFDGPSAFPAMEDTIKNAKRTVHVAFYIFRNDDTGRKIRDLLVERARAGVEVRVLVDAWGSPRFTGSFSNPLRQAGAKVAAFLPSHFMPLLAPRFNFANHRKMLIVDDNIAFLGGMNVGDEYALRWRDVMARLEGPSVRALDHVFLDDWFFATGDDESRAELEDDPPAGAVSCAVVASGPDRQSFIHDAYFILFTHANERIWIVTPYFIPSDAIATALRTAAGHGVDVRVLVPLSSDIGVIKHAARSYYPELLASGVRIYEYEGPMLHAKAFIVDQNISSVGSANVDARSFRLNFEVSCFVEDRAKNSQIAEWYEDLLADSHEVTLPECEARSTGEKLLESAAHLLSPIL